MKTLYLKSIALIILAMAGVNSLQSQGLDTFRNSNQYMDSVAAMEMFRTQLSNMGEWINIDSSQVDAEAVRAIPSDPEIVNEGFDDNLNRNIIWRPYIDDPNWNPYSYGFWQYTSCGWMWISYYRWGWWTCHYGRWWYSEEYGWVWSPGYEWGPSWVEWCYNEDYDVWGWYPISPREHCGGEEGGHHGNHHVRHTDPHWVFVHTKDFEKTITGNTVVDGSKTPGLVNGRKVVNTIKKTEDGRVINDGPDKTAIEEATGKKIQPVNVDALRYPNGTIFFSGEKTKGDVVSEEPKKNEGKGIVGEKKEPVKSDEGKKIDNREKTVWQKEKDKQKSNTDNEKKSGNSDYNVKKEEHKSDNNNTNTYNYNTNDNKNTEKTVEKKQDPPPPPPPPPQKIDDPPPKKDPPKVIPKQEDTKKGDN